MSASLLNALLVVVLLLNFFSLGTSRIRAMIHSAAAQGICLGLMPLLLQGNLVWWSIAVAAVTVVLKGVIIPQMLLKALRDAQIKREVEPLVALLPTMLLGALGAAASMAITARLPLVSHQAGLVLIMPVAFTTILTGFLILTTRIKAISQATGYLVLENGIFIFGLLLFDAMPMVVEAGVLLDLFVAIFVISIIINHINREFASLDTRRLSALKD